MDIVILPGQQSEARALDGLGPSDIVIDVDRLCRALGGGPASLPLAAAAFEQVIKRLNVATQADRVWITARDTSEALAIRARVGKRARIVAAAAPSEDASR